MAERPVEILVACGSGIASSSVAAEAVKKICKENGTTIEEVTRDFLCFCADPKNTPFLQRWFKNNEQ